MKYPIITTENFFDEIVTMLKTNGEYPDILGYHCADRYSVKEIKDIDFDVRTGLMFGANEGIYLDVYLEGDIGFYDKDVHTFSLGTFKTLGTSKEDMRKMGILAADFIIAAKEYACAHKQELLRVGYQLEFYDGENRKSALWLGAESKENAVEKAKEYLLNKKYTKAIVTNCYSGEETIVNS